jgi:hypothetical protein
MKSLINPEFEEITIYRDGAKNIKSTSAALVASVESSSNQAMGRMYSGSVGRFAQLAIYQTARGVYLCEKIERTQWQGEKNRFYGAVCKTASEIIEFFGQGWLAHELYDLADIENAETID